MMNSLGADSSLSLDAPDWRASVPRFNLDSHGVPELFLEIVGRWEGRYYKVAPDATKLKAFDGTFEIRIEAHHYTQTNRYLFSDGSRRQLEFSGTFDHGILIMESTSRQSFRARAWQAGPRLILFESVKQEDGSQIRYLESILIDSPTTRARTTLEYRDGVFAGVNFIQETKF